MTSAIPAPDPEPVASTPLDATPAPRTAPAKAPCPTCGQAKRPNRRQRETTDEEYRRSLWRLIANYGRRIREGGTGILADAVALRDALDQVIDAGVDDCRGGTWSASWTEIGAATNMTKQAAQQRWGSLGGARKPGGQPSSLR